MLAEGAKVRSQSCPSLHQEAEATGAERGALVFSYYWWVLSSANRSPGHQSMFRQSRDSDLRKKIRAKNKEEIMNKQGRARAGLSFKLFWHLSYFQSSFWGELQCLFSSNWNMGCRTRWQAWRLKKKKSSKFRTEEYWGCFFNSLYRL